MDLFCGTGGNYVGTQADDGFGGSLGLFSAVGGRAEMNGWPWVF
jgi:hypothetical protein